VLTVPHSLSFKYLRSAVEAVADRRAGVGRGRVGLNTIGRVAALAAATMVVAVVVVMTMMMMAREFKAAALLPSNGMCVLLGRSLQLQACETHVCAIEQMCVRDAIRCQEISRGMQFTVGACVYAFLDSAQPCTCGRCCPR